MTYHYNSDWFPVTGRLCAGKSAVTGRFVGDDFYEHYNPTIETTKSKRLKTSRGHDTTVDVIDLAGMVGAHLN